MRDRPPIEESLRVGERPAAQGPAKIIGGPAGTGWKAVAVSQRAVRGDRAGRRRPPFEPCEPKPAELARQEGDLAVLLGYGVQPSGRGPARGGAGDRPRGRMARAGRTEGLRGPHRVTVLAQRPKGGVRA